MESVQAYIDGLCARFKELSENANRRAQDLGNMQSGPLADAKAKLLQLRMKANVQQMKLDQLRKRVSGACTALQQKWEEDQRKAIEAKAKEESDRIVKAVTETVQAAEDQAGKIEEGVRSAEFTGMKSDLSGAALETMSTNADNALQALKDAKDKVAEVIARVHKEGGKSQMSMKVELTKLQNRCVTMDRKTRAAADVVRRAREQVVKDALVQLKSSMRKALRNIGKSSDELFDEYAQGGSELDDEQLAKLLESMPEHGLSTPDALRMLHQIRSGGLRRQDLARVCQEYRSCRKPIALTVSFDINQPETVRMLTPGEVLEILEGPVDDDKGSRKVSRVRGRALKDRSTGWVTTTGNLGTLFLEECEKPFMKCSVEASLRETADDASNESRTIDVGEVLEVLEGPRQETAEPEKFLKGTAVKDGASGWIRVKDANGGDIAVHGKKSFYVCKSMIALTDQYDIQKCGILRKVSTGEVFEEVESPDGKPEEGASISRKRVKSTRDGDEGWITLKGSQGTTYLEPAASYYMLQQSTPLQLGKPGDSGGKTVVRQLEEGEAFEAPGKPEAGKAPAPRCVVRVRAGSDGAEGWVSWSTSSPALLQQATGAQA